MPKISFHRHSKVNLDSVDWISPRELPTAIYVYNSAPIAPVAQNLAVPGVCYVVSSDLRRSSDTAKTLYGRADICGALFREAELPELRFWAPKLPCKAWFLVARVLWLLKPGSKCENKTDFVTRAKNATVKLVQLAQNYDHIALIGHGFMNRQIIKNLKNHNFKAKASHRRNQHQSAANTYAA